jgi:glycosyltransferase involved in cell wall biosynthesis
LQFLCYNTIKLNSGGAVDYRKNGIFMSKICFVIPEISHIENNDISISIYNFANTLVNDKHDVTVFYTSICNNIKFEYWKSRYIDIGAKFEYLLDTDINVSLSAPDLFFRNSYAVYKKLENSSYDFIHFTDFYAAGFHTIQAKKTTSLFKNTTITVLMQGATELGLEIMQEWCKNPVLEMRLQYAERYCCENADVLISVSAFLFSWANNKGWNLPKKNFVIQNCFTGSIVSPLDYKVNKEKLVFWGSFENVDSIKAFCNSVIELKNQNYSLQKVSFIIDSLLINTNDYTEYIKQQMKINGISCIIKTKLSTADALTYIKNDCGLVVFTSKSDNYQCTLIDCIKNNINFLATSVGGVPELVDEHVLFEPNSISLIKKLQSFTIKKLNHKYSDAFAKETWLNFHKEFSQSNSNQKSESIVEPKVSVCIAYFNHGKYLPMMLESLEKSTYTNFEVIVVNDGSTDPFSISVFEDMQRKYKSMPYKFYSKENGYMGQTRNYAVNYADGEYIIFVDSDDFAATEMIEKFVYGIINSGCDCLSAYLKYYHGEGILEESGISEGLYSPTGPVLELAMFENCIGSVNIIIKKDVFLKLGGFSTERFCYEDWRFLIKLTIKGYKLDIIPIPIYYYRILSNSMNRNKDNYKSQKWLLTAFYEDMPQYMQYLVKNFCIPSWNKWVEVVPDNKNSEIDIVNNLKITTMFTILVKKIIKRIFRK